MLALKVVETTDDETLIREFVRSGDLASFNELVSRHKVSIRKIIFTVLGSMDLSLTEDAEQEVLLSLYKNLRKFRFRSSFRTWLYTVCRNKALDVLKREKRANPELTLLVGEESGEGPEEIYIKKESKEELFHTLSLLDEKERTIIVLKELEQLPLEEVSKIMKIPLGTVKSKLHRSRKKLEKLLEETYG